MRNPMARYLTWTAYSPQEPYLSPVRRTRFEQLEPQIHPFNILFAHNADFNRTVFPSPNITRQQCGIRIHDCATSLAEAPGWPRDRDAQEGGS